MVPGLVPWHGLTPHTAERVGWEGRRERHLLWSPTLRCPVVPGPVASLQFTLFLYAWACVLWKKSGDGRWDGERTGVWGCFAIWPIPCSGWESRAKGEQAPETSRLNTVKNGYFSTSHLIFHLLIFSLKSSRGKLLLLQHNLNATQLLFSEQTDSILQHFNM